MFGFEFVSQAYAAAGTPPPSASSSNGSFVGVIILVAAIIGLVRAYKSRNKYNSKIFGRSVFLVSVVWCAVLIIRVKSIFGQKFLMLTGSNLFDARGIVLGEGVYLMYWLVGLSGIFLGLWSFNTSFKQRITESIESLTSKKSTPTEKEKKCPMCAEIIMKEAKICKHCRHEFHEN